MRSSLRPNRFYEREETQKAPADEMPEVRIRAELAHRVRISPARGSQPNQRAETPPRRLLCADRCADVALSPVRVWVGQMAAASVGREVGKGSRVNRPALFILSGAAAIVEATLTTTFLQPENP